MHILQIGESNCELCYLFHIYLNPEMSPCILLFPHFYFAGGNWQVNQLELQASKSRIVLEVDGNFFNVLHRLTQCENAYKQVAVGERWLYTVLKDVLSVCMFTTTLVVLPLG